MTTLSGLIDQLRDEIKIDPKGTINSDTLLTRNINRALRRIQEDTSYDLPENQGVALVSVQSGVREYDLPTDFKRMGEPQSVKWGKSTILSPSDYNTLLAHYDLDDNASTSNRYYIRKESGDWKIGLYPIPSSSEIVTAPYLKSLPEISASQDSPLPTDFDEVIVVYASYLTLRRLPGYEQQSMINYQAYKELLKPLLANALTYNRHALRFTHQRRGRFTPNPKSVGGFNNY